MHAWNKKTLIKLLVEQRDNYREILFFLVTCLNFVLVYSNISFSCFSSCNFVVYILCIHV